jgi:peptidoglycan hydrolase-like protein with peptidoglycan-binding domain
VYGGGPYYWWGYPYGLGYYDYYDGPYSYSDDQNSNTVTASWESTVVAVQQELAKLGYYHGQIDGIDGPETQKAIRWFQSTDKIAVTGQINDQTLKALQIS